MNKKEEFAFNFVLVEESSTTLQIVRGVREG